jgi:son of sevenless-like protein
VSNDKLGFPSTSTDSDYVDNFLLTYRNFITPADMLQKLFERYESGMETVSADDVSDFEAGSIEKKKKIVRLRFRRFIDFSSFDPAYLCLTVVLVCSVGNVIKRWVSDHFHDFFADPSLLAALEAGLEKIQERGLVDSIKKLVQEQRVAKEKSTKKEAMFSTPPPSSVVPKASKFEDFDIVECARQICLLEQEIYARIHPKEALNQNWNKRREQAPNIIAMITFFNQLSKWVSTKIVSVAELKPRSKLLKKFIQLLIKLREYNNFDAMQAVLAGLSNSAVYRLKQTWAKAQKEKFWAQFEECQTLMDSLNNFSNFRDAVQHADPPIIPYLGVYLTDLTFIEDGNNSSLPVADGRTDIINFEVRLCFVSF